MPRILFVAQGFWIKGGNLFLEAIARLRGSFEFQVDFVCDLPLECLHYRTTLADVVNFHEPTFSRNELFTRFYPQADVFAMLGMADSYGLALVEASAFGLPIVAMRLNSGLSDLLSITGNAVQVEPACQIFDESGLHCREPEDLVSSLRRDSPTAVTDRIASALACLISDRARREQMGARGRAAVFEGPLSASVMRDAVLNIYRSVEG